MAYDPEFFDAVAGMLEGEWPVGAMELGGRNNLFGEIEDLLFEIDPQVYAPLPGPVVLVRTDFARLVPESEELHVTLLQLNKNLPMSTFGVRDESDADGTLCVRVFSSVLGDAARSKEMVVKTLQDCLAPAKQLLDGGFLDRFGGELGSVVTKREIGISP